MTETLTEQWRKHFPILKNKMIQLSSCSQSAMSTFVDNSIDEYKYSLSNNGMNWEIWMEKVEQARCKFAKLINADVEEVAVVSSVSHALSAIASSISFRSERNEVLISDMDFPTVGHVWLSQQDRGASIKFIPSCQDTIPLKNLERSLTEKTLITSVSHISFYNGFKLDLKKVSELVHHHGSYLFVDAYQSAGQAAIDVKEMNIDFLTTGMQKYLLGIPGIAFMYVKKEIAEQLIPHVTGWFGQKNPFAFDLVNLDYATSTRRFDAGTPPIINAYAADAALHIILSVGVERIEDYLRKLSEFTMNYAKEQGLTTKSPYDPKMKGSNTAISIPDANKAEKYLLEKKIIVSARKDVIRISPHFYNNETDIKTALDTLLAWKSISS